MKTHPITNIPDSWIGRPVALLDTHGQPFVSGDLIMHTAYNGAACEECGHRRGIRAQVVIRVHPGIDAQFDLGADVTVAPAEARRAG